MIKPINSTDNINNRQQNNKKQITKDGILVDKLIKDDKVKLSYSDIESPQENIKQIKGYEFNITNAIMPLALGTFGFFAGITALSGALLKSSKTLKSAKPFETLPDLATNMNIRQETHFAAYRMLRDPNTKNIAGALGVFIYSGLALAAKNFVDGTKEIWIRKRQADIERDLQENLIKVETDCFSGKINTVNQLLYKNSKYMSDKINFSGKDNNKKNETGKLIFLSATMTLASILAGKMTYSNIKKSLKNANDFTNNYTEKAISKIESIIKSKNPNIDKLKELFSIIDAKPEYIKQTLKKAKLNSDEIAKFINDVEKEQKSLFTNAPTALGGIPEKIQYYCYLDEDRGHLYNWILHPENKFAKYLFLSFATITSIGYIGKQILDAIKEVTVLKENAKTELDLKKRLVEVEVENFKSKKNAAIKPLIDNFNKQVANEKSKEKLKTNAENILSEIKNGPPYIFG